MRRKYGNKKIVIDGITFDSKKEAAFYNELKLRKKAHDIVDFKIKPKFILQEGFLDNDNKKIRPITYTADFLIYHDGKTEIVDVKPSKNFTTQVFKIKWKLLKWKYRERGYKYTLIY